jgi:hypothetical protein
MSYREMNMSKNIKRMLFIILLMGWYLLSVPVFCMSVNNYGLGIVPPLFVIASMSGSILALLIIVGISGDEHES